MKLIPLSLSLLLLAACSKREDIASKDSALVGPITEIPPAPPKEDTSGLVVDSFMVRQQPEMEALKRLEPKQVAELYNEYRPLRHRRTTRAEVDSFLRVHKITAQELHALLVEGDRLGWAGPPKH